jgi:hypothetical protein
MSPKLKVVTWIVGIVAAYAVSVGIGAYRIVSAEMFPLGRERLGGLPGCHEVK